MTFFLVWYALGWVAMGINFIYLRDGSDAQAFICFMIPPLIFIVAVLMIFEGKTLFNPANQYAWKRGDSKGGKS